MVEFSSVAGQPGTTPVSQALPWALAWSTILGSRISPVGSPFTVEPVGVSILDRGYDCLSQFRDDHLRERRSSTPKTGGFIGHRGQPYREAPPPARPKPSPHQQHCRVTIDGPMSLAFASPLSLPACCLASRCCCQDSMSWASHVAAGHALDTRMLRGRTPGVWARAAVNISAS